MAQISINRLELLSIIFIILLSLFITNKINRVLLPFLNSEPKLDTLEIKIDSFELEKKAAQEKLSQLKIQNLELGIQIRYLEDMNPKIKDSTIQLKVSREIEINKLAREKIDQHLKILIDSLSKNRLVFKAHRKEQEKEQFQNQILTKFVQLLIGTVIFFVIYHLIKYLSNKTFKNKEVTFNLNHVFRGSFLMFFLAFFQQVFGFEGLITGMFIFVLIALSTLFSESS